MRGKKIGGPRILISMISRHMNVLGVTVPEDFTTELAGVGKTFNVCLYVPLVSSKMS